MASFGILELDVLRWAEARDILKHSNPMAQASKTIEEVGELVAALNNNDRTAAKDAYGDILVTLIVGSDMLNLSLLECLESAYDEIKDRRGKLNSAGVFVKEAN